MEKLKVGERIVINTKVMVGKPVIRGTRIPVDAIIKRIADGMTTKEILEDYPNLTEEDIELIRGEDVMPLSD